MNAKDGLLIFKYSDCNKIDEKKLDKDLAKRFEHTQSFCDGDINKFCLMLWQGAYPYKYMNNCHE